MVFPAQLDLSTLDGTNGFIVDGFDNNNRSGVFVSAAGDINGDGLADIIVGESHTSADGSVGTGGGYIIFGQSGEFEAQYNLAGLESPLGFYIQNAEDNIGLSSARYAGDVNGDGIDDIVIGEKNSTRSYGKSYVVFGNDSGFATQFDLSSLDGTNGFSLKGVDVLQSYGTVVSDAGDVNGDGIDDIIIGDRSVYSSGYNAGQSYVVFGQNSGFESQLDLSALDGVQGFKINGTDSFDFSGSSVSGAGDINGDGLDDLIIRGYREHYVVFGQNAGEGAVDLATLDGTNGFRLNGIEATGAEGAISDAGDVNGDGIDDIIVGVPRDLPIEEGAGLGFVVFGTQNGFEAQVDLSELNGTNGFKITGLNVGDNLGISVSSVGDVNGDDIDDIILGATGADPNGVEDAGQSYVVFGQSSGFTEQVDLSQLDGSNGFSLNGTDAGDQLGQSVSDAGDVNGDGIADFIVGAALADSNGFTDAGQSYIIFGQDGDVISQETLPEGTENADILIGTPQNDKLNGKGGDDKIQGEGGDDTLRGGIGNDLVLGGSGRDLIVGGVGNDRIIGGGGRDTLIGGKGEDSFIFQNKHQGSDFISDFDPTEDRILIKSSGFNLDLSKGKLSNSRFSLGTAAVRKSDRFIYNPATGELLFDPDGNRAQNPTTIATLDSGLELSASNIYLS